ncbi:TetR/AcrR family transcriptional regulator [Salinithrix halophila]|uniref:TetR/AcrR family transcriptional regulator n=1 Tax=Salinithrix halophila TaxID=1485204 RepID=A0ABV8JFQ2_9BACL
MKENKIIQAARQLFAEKGYKDTSMADIVKASNSSKGNVYYHFKSKEDLFLHVIEEDDKAWEESWKKEQQKYKTARDQLLGLANFSAVRDAHHPLNRAFAEFYSQPNHSPAIQEKMNELSDRYISIIENIIVKGNQNKEWNVSDVKQVSAIATAIFTGLEIHTNRDSVQKRQEVFRRTIEIFIGGINE